MGAGASEFLIRLFHHRWAAAVSIEVARGEGARFAELGHRLGAPAGSLRSSLANLIELGLIQRNPGYGHPLRPEYILTRSGIRIVPPLERLLSILDALKVREIGLRKWSIPVIDALGRGQNRFRDLSSDLPSISPRALAQTLKDLLAAGLIRREVLPEFPPVSVYRLTTGGRRLARAARAAEQAARAPSPSRRA